MGLFSKKDDVPELPRAPTLPRLSEGASKPNMLPSISNKGGGKIGDQLVKSAVTDTDSHLNNSMMGDLHLENSNEAHKKEVFVKLEKFTQAQKTFEQMKSKMVEIESLVNKAKQLNEKERSELETWHQELNNIKSKVNEIDSEVFNQI